MNGLGFEKKSIVDIDYDTKIITLDSALENWHYGHQYATIANNDESELNIDSKFGPGLDMRCTVGHITRNIKISGTDEDSL